MSQKSVTTTTSFIISSNESLNKHQKHAALSLSSSQSSGSNDNMTTESGRNQYFVPPNPGNNNMMINQQQQQQHLHTQSSYVANHPNDFIYGSNGTGVGINNNNSNLNDQLQCNGNQVQASPTNDKQIYTIYHSQQQQQSNKLQFSGLNSTTGAGIKQSFPSPVALENDLNSSTITTNGSTNNKTNGQAQSYSPKTQNHNNATTIQSFQNNKPVINSNQTRSSLSSLESSNSSSLMPLNVKSMLLHGVTGDDVIRNWLTSIKCEEYVGNFVHNGYDMMLLKRMTPQDLTAIGCKSPAIRKKLLVEIKKLNLEDDIPETRPHSLEKWLELLKLGQYYDRLCNEGYTTIDKVCELTWEDLEEIGITKLGHQKRLLLGIEKILKFDRQQEERQNDFAIYDVHPNHRMSLNPEAHHRLSTLGRATVRSGFFQTRPGANLDHRGLPVATVMPALKHVNNTLANLDISHQTITNGASSAKSSSPPTVTNGNNNNNRLLKTSEFLETQQPMGGGGGHQLSNQENNNNATLKKNPPPLPPIRSNSLKLGPQDFTQLNTMMNGTNNNMNSIYGNSNYGVAAQQQQQQQQQPQNNGGGGGSYAPMTTGSTSFLRTPKLGTLTATTNKMLMHGGHIQTVSQLGAQQQTTLRSIVPVREAPLPPIPMSQPATIPEKNEEEAAAAAMGMQQRSFNGPSLVNQVDCAALLNTSAISHQLASADEFPPPPPSQ